MTSTQELKQYSFTDDQIDFILDIITNNAQYEDDEELCLWMWKLSRKIEVQIVNHMENEWWHPTHFLFKETLWQFSDWSVSSPLGSSWCYALLVTSIPLIANELLQPQCLWRVYSLQGEGFAHQDCCPKGTVSPHHWPSSLWDWGRIPGGIGGFPKRHVTVAQVAPEAPRRP